MDSVVFSVFLLVLISIILLITVLGWRKGLVASSLLLTIVLGVTTYLVVKDTKDFQENIMTKEKLLVLMDGKKAVTALSFTSLENSSSKNPIHVMKDSELKAIESDLNIGYTKNIKEKYYKTIVFKKEMFNETLENGLTYEMEGQKIEITKKEFNDLISSDDPSKILINKIMATEGYTQKAVSPQMLEEAKKEIYKKLNIESPEQLKGYASILLIADYAKEKGATNLVFDFKKENIEVYPKTAVFRMIDAVPNYLIEKIIQKVVSDKEEA